MRSHVLLMMLGTIALVVGAGCKDEGPILTAVHGVVEVTAATTGIDLDRDGYTAQLDAGTPRQLPVNGKVTFEGLAAGDHSVMVAGAAGNCTIRGANPRTVSVTTGGTARTTYEVTCVANGVIEVRVATSGADLPNRYLVGVDQLCDFDDNCDYVWSELASVNDTVRFAAIPAGTHYVYLGFVPSNCTDVAEPSPRVATVQPGDTARIAFAVSCQQTGRVRVTVSTTGVDLDPDGYFVQVSGHGVSSVGVNASRTFALLLPGEYDVRLGGLAANCTVDRQNPVTVTVVAGVTVDAAFAVTCAALGSLQITAVTTGVDLDPDGYNVLVKGPAQSYGVGTNGTVTISRLVAGDYSVTLTGIAANCEAAVLNPQTVAVPVGGGTAAVRFDVGCTAVAQLAFVTSIYGNPEIYLVKANGAGETRLTTNSAADVHPAWSPDGAQIAFATDRDGNYEIYVMTAGGQNPERRTTAPGADYAPAWSPDGGKIAFTSARDGNAEIYVMDADGSNQVRLTNDPGSDAEPAWSPDGSKIAFTSDRAGNPEIYLMDADGRNVERRTSNDVADVHPGWSPDGTKLVFSRFTSCASSTRFCDYDLFVMNADGSGAARLTSASSDAEPTWSPDGHWIAFAASFCNAEYYPPCNYDYTAIELVRPDGTGLLELTRYAFQPAWRP